MTYGYSGTPLAKKLGIKPLMRAYIGNPPSEYWTLLGDLEGVTCLSTWEPHLDFIHLFSLERDEFEQALPLVEQMMQKNGMVWFSWVKKSVKIPTNITEDGIREMVLPRGLVDVKVCAINAQWSALKVVWRKEYR